MGESLRRSGVLMTVSLSGVCAVLLDFNAEGHGGVPEVCCHNTDIGSREKP